MNELVSYEALKERLLTIPNEEHRALLCTIYACMARVGEIVNNRYTKEHGLLAGDGVVFPNKLVLKVKTEKTNRLRKVILFKNREAWLIEIIVNWATPIDEDLPLFPFSTSKAENIFKKYFPEFTAARGNLGGNSKHTIHWLRGWRYTHYRRGSITGKMVEGKVASLLGGWVSSATPERYYDFTEIEDHERELENA